METKKSTVILIYSSLIGLVATFFSFILTPIQTSASGGEYGISTSQSTLITLLANGTISGGIFVLIMLFIVLILALVVDIILTIRITKGYDVPKALYILTLIYGIVTLIVAITFIAIFFSHFGGQFVSVESSSSSSTVTSGIDVWYAYLFLFEAAGTAIIAGIMGLKSSSIY